MISNGKIVTEAEKRQIEAFSKTGIISCILVAKIEQKTVVCNFLKLKEYYGKKNTGEWPNALSFRNEGRVCSVLSMISLRILTTYHLI